jgi:hypothetical protein
MPPKIQMISLEDAALGRLIFFFYNVLPIHAY